MDSRRENFPGIPGVQLGQLKAWGIVSYSLDAKGVSRREKFPRNSGCACRARQILGDWIGDARGARRGRECASMALGRMRCQG